MLSGTTAGKKLDLSRLTDEEAKHVWDVVQRDFDLRKKEEDRLGDLKTKIEKEDTKRELLGNQSSLTETHCIRCLQPYKFLVNSKCQCLDCKLYTCKSCSRYNKKDQGWVCDPCRMARVLKIGTLEWYHETVRARFKRFGSAKVMRSLFKRQSGELTGSQTDLREPGEYDTHSNPDVHTDGYEEHNAVTTDRQHYKGCLVHLADTQVEQVECLDSWSGLRLAMAEPVPAPSASWMKKTKRLLPVHPFDFQLDPECYSPDSRRRSYQLSHAQGEFHEGGGREPMVEEADMSSLFQQILNERQDQEPEFTEDIQLHFKRTASLEKPLQHDDSTYPDNRGLRTRSLSHLSHSSAGSGTGSRRSGSYLLGPDDWEEENEEYQHYPLYASHHHLPQSYTSQESLSSQAPAPPITELNRRMSAIETLLNRLEQKVTSSPVDQASRASQASASSSPLPQWEDMDLEEQQLRQKLDELTGNISDRGLTSDEDEPDRPLSPREGTAIPTRPPSTLSSTAGSLVNSPVDKLATPTESQRIQANYSSGSLERRCPPLEKGSKASFRGSTALLNELEGKVAQAAASVQSTQSEVSYIENRIAALSAAGMSVDKTRRKSATPVMAPSRSHNFPTKTSDVTGSMTRRRLSIM